VSQQKHPPTAPPTDTMHSANHTGKKK